MAVWKSPGRRHSTRRGIVTRKSTRISMRRSAVAALTPAAIRREQQRCWPACRRSRPISPHSPSTAAGVWTSARFWAQPRRARRVTRVSTGRRSRRNPNDQRLSSASTTVGTLTTYTGNTPQTGDSYAYLATNLGALGAEPVERLLPMSRILLAILHIPILVVFHLDWRLSELWTLQHRLAYRGVCR